MSKYTTGEMAKRCNVTVRTVQYYDSRNILVPSELSEGGRRLYSEEDLKRLQIICFLRSIGLPIDTISQLLQEEHPESVISILLEEQKKELSSEIEERQEKLNLLNNLEKELKHIRHFTIDSIGDVAQIMENKKNLQKLRRNMLIVGFIMDAIEAGTLMLWILKGIWQPFALGMVVVIALGIWISTYYFTHVDYLCPECHTIFRSNLKETLWARHTPKTRKLTCSHCGHHGFCVEMYASSTENVALKKENPNA